ncbi:MAG TPA: class I SAM-dependent methyltransferase [Rhizomicrobium sp.]|nr:class I SAM-dependent methyltransferase [Rhizomicrobium sp.]
MIQPTAEILDYLARLGGRETVELARCRRETAKRSDAVMQIAPEQGAFLALLVRIVGAKRIIEVGSFTGYSALAMAEALPESGRLVALDVSKEFTDIAQGYWKRASVDKKIELRLGPALPSLEKMIAASEGPFDLVFIDADKTGYDGYYEAALKLLRPGGVIALDNMLYSGEVAAKRQGASAAALAALNTKIHADHRVDMALATIGDGLMLARKR